MNMHLTSILPAAWPLIALQAEPAPAPAAPGAALEVVGAPTSVPAAASTTAAPLVPGATPAGAQPAPRPAGGFDPFFMIVIFALLAMMIVTSILGARRDKKRREELMGNLGSGDRVQTIGGLLGTIIEVKDDEVLLRVDENTNTRIAFAKSAVQQVLRKGNAPSRPSDAKADRADAKAVAAR